MNIQTDKTKVERPSQSVVVIIQYSNVLQVEQPLTDNQSPVILGETEQLKD